MIGDDGMTEALRIAICEDEKNERDKLLAFLDESDTENVYSVFESGESLLEVFENGKFDLIFMDIYMNSSITGIDAVKLIREKDKEIPVAFVTTSKEHALESYRLSAMKYIEKPYEKESIEDMLSLAFLKRGELPSLTVHKNGIAEKIPFSKILYIEQQMHKVLIYLKGEDNLEIYGKLSDLESQLPENLFFSPHKSFAVNLSFVKFIDMEIKCFAMENNKNVPINREFLPKSKKALEDYLYENTRGLLK